MVCANAICGFIQEDKASGGDLYKHIRHRKPYQKPTGSTDARNQIIERTSIDKCPAIVEEKVRLGDWEADTVIGIGRKLGAGEPTRMHQQKDTYCPFAIQACKGCHGGYH
jgi:IS30 family transposase